MEKIHSCTGCFLRSYGTIIPSISILCYFIFEQNFVYMVTTIWYDRPYLAEVGDLTNQMIYWHKPSTWRTSKKKKEEGRTVRSTWPSNGSILWYDSKQICRSLWLTLTTGLTAIPLKKAPYMRKQVDEFR